MNERIKQLMLKAGGVLAPAYVTDANDNSVWTENAKVDTIDMDAEYFAKLLLRECVAVIQEELDHGQYSQPVHTGFRVSKNMIKEHFGVEE